MAKDKKKKDKKNPVEQGSEALDRVEDSAHKIWLAGLGAFHKAEKEGQKLFETLVKQGTAVEEQYKDYLVGSVKKAASTTSSTIDLMEKMFEKRMAEAIARVPAPAADSMDAVVKQMSDLRRSILGIMGVSAETPETGKDAPKASAPKKKVVSKKAVQKKVTKKKVSKKPVVRKTTARKAAVSKKPAVRKTTAKKAAVSKKPAVRKTTASKVAGKTTANKTTASSTTKKAGA